MKARLRKPIEGLEVDTIYDFWSCIDEDYRGYLHTSSYIEVTLSSPNNYKALQYNSIEDFLEDFEVLQPVSDTTKQAIEILATRFKELCRIEASSINYMQDNLSLNQFVAAVVSVLEGEQ